MLLSSFRRKSLTLHTLSLMLIWLNNIKQDWIALFLWHRSDNLHGRALNRFLFYIVTSQFLLKLSLFTQPLRLNIQPNHSEQIRCYVLQHAQPFLVLGLPWLHSHNPVIDWQAARVLSWSPHCTISCISPMITVYTTAIESPVRTFSCQLPLWISHAHWGI